MLCLPYDPGILLSSASHCTSGLCSGLISPEHSETILLAYFIAYFFPFGTVVSFARKDSNTRLANCKLLKLWYMGAGAWAVSN